MRGREDEQAGVFGVDLGGGDGNWEGRGMGLASGTPGVGEAEAMQGVVEGL